MISPDIFNITNDLDFKKRALEVFEYQYLNNEVYQSFCNYLNKDLSNVKTIVDIPFLPIEFFKSKIIVSSDAPVQATFTSSGTTGNNTSKHHVTDLKLYQKSYTEGFNHFYNAIDGLCILALLPSYLERQGSSLIYMVEDLIKESNHKQSGFYLDNFITLKDRLEKLDSSGVKTLLIGVSFALLDFVEQYSFNLKNTIIMETGGMKGRRKELVREELHALLKQGFGVSTIHSEYGMTELLSQAYSMGDGIFNTPPWMQVFIRDTEDPLSYQSNGKTGGLNIIDLANVNSCSFIATQDLGKRFDDGSFQIIGRFDNSDIRGCNLMVM